MNKLFRLFNFMFMLVPLTVLNGIRMICFDDYSIDEVLFEVSKVKKKTKKVSKKAKMTIVKEYLNDCLKSSLN